MASKSTVPKTDATSSALPRHVAIIMDGNGRWAKAKGLPRLMGHERGALVVRKIFKFAAQKGIEFLTLYAFSSENWNRPKSEVSALMKLLVKTIKKYSGEFEENEIRFRTIGDVSKLPSECVEALESLKKRTQNFTKANLVLALNYGSRDELLRAISKLEQKKISAPTWEDVAANLDTAGIPDPDFLIRTSGEMRLSNYLLLQAAYAELYFTDVLWPDFNEAEFQKAIDEYAKRERRYGLTTEQLKNND